MPQCHKGHSAPAAVAARHLQQHMWQRLLKRVDEHKMKLRTGHVEIINEEDAPLVCWWPKCATRPLVQATHHDALQVPAQKQTKDKQAGQI